MQSEPHESELRDEDTPPLSALRWKSAVRIVSSRFPPIDIFERVAKPDDWDALYALESLSNPRLRQEVGDISLVPPQRRVSGRGASIVMAPFTHISRARPTRFSAGDYGVYYAGRNFETALSEICYHRARFFRATNDPVHREQFRVYKGAVQGKFKLHDLRSASDEASSLAQKWSHLLHPAPERYDAPQAFARALRSAGSNGLVYPSVRCQGGQCIAAFYPDVVAIPQQTSHIALRWDGEKISSWFDYQKEKWHEL